MRNLRIGMVGLGDISQKAYLPILSKEIDWDFIGAFSPNKEKCKRICKQYRIQDFNNITLLARECDAIFVHSSTDSHFEVVSTLLNMGKDVYVDKPLAATISDAEKLVELSEKTGRKIMVGFNRRFSPMYIKAKQEAKKASLIRIEKHRIDSVGPYSYEFTMIDDYLHLVDTIRWLGNDDLYVLNGTINVNTENHLLYANHIFKTSDGTSFCTTMHRKAGTNVELLNFLTEGALVQVKNLNTLEIERAGILSTEYTPSWDSILKQKGFEDAVYHFIRCIQNDIQPCINGIEGLKSQLLVHQLLQNKE
ncbi:MULTISPECIES: Gfo/Idh/MocA family protein [Bacillus cereus group]|uniref:Gfo/Idh/MocA family protein n=1 Tax=Bacillus cereus group TaxID=86661 RepID=UPI00065F92EC|nr:MULTISPECIES: Gfo/Idh/MocA family oxidoreductase [Bacillus cereus group]AWC32001.1 gfo/Idh/MocA family oxidoreductase [Bacillus cytotoxicus]AWC36033.1 gfo/Idh/MocA family oxidoreductase [Bacillus cytotoxicus]AWC60278.1 gfo/Idh/MocA family oxidoreductase [Bacillus cytotoxicus]KMT50493.1 virulence factor MviM [Bacillus cytotoxicus]HDR7308373.1 Gfo/Idh/MocA family oxidoreductase [Bacillus cytotoxicus]